MGSIQEQPSKDSDTEVKPIQKLGGWKRFSSSFNYAFSGIKIVWQKELNFRIELCCACLALFVAWVLKVSLIPIILCCSLVLSLELVNSALEYVLDLVSPEYHSSVKHAKDIAAGAVLLASIASLGVASLLFLPIIFDKI